MATDNNKAEIVLGKTKKEMSDIEKMMSEIIEQGAQKKEKEVADEDILEAIIPEPPKKKTRLYPLPVRPEAHSAPPDKRAIETDPVLQQTIAETNRRREKNIAKKRMNKKLPVIITLAFLICAGAFLFGATVKNIRNDVIDNAVSDIKAVAQESGLQIPTPEPGDEAESLTGSIVMVTDPNDINELNESTPSEDMSMGLHYRLFREDVSWQSADQKCKELGGHLVNVRNEEELEEIIKMAEEEGVNRLWIGCRRNDFGDYIWQNDEEIEIPDSWWGKGEPSLRDYGDDVAENYLMLWYNNGKWSLNDSRNDPVADYYDMYAGDIAYICEFESNANKNADTDAENADT